MATWAVTVELKITFLLYRENKTELAMTFV